MLIGHAGQIRSVGLIRPSLRMPIDCRLLWLARVLAANHQLQFVPSFAEARRELISVTRKLRGACAHARGRTWPESSFAPQRCRGGHRSRLSLGTGNVSFLLSSSLRMLGVLEQGRPRSRVGLPHPWQLRASCRLKGSPDQVNSRCAHQRPHDLCSRNADACSHTAGMAAHSRPDQHHLKLLPFRVKHFATPRLSWQTCPWPHTIARTLCVHALESPSIEPRQPKVLTRARSVCMRLFFLF